MAAETLSTEHLGLWRTILRARATIVGEVEDALIEAGLPPLAWYDVLWPLAENGPLRMGELADRVVTVGRTGLSRLVDRLENDGAVRRDASGEDGRVVVVSITRSGRRTLSRIWRVYEQALVEHLAGVFSEQDARYLAERLRALG